MPTTLPATAAAYVESINRPDPAAYLALFADQAVVEDAGRTFRGRDEIKHWSENEIFAVHVTLEVLDAFISDDRAVLRAKVDGTFDRSGLPDPLIIDQDLTLSGDRIAKLQCRLAEDAPLGSIQ